MALMKHDSSEDVQLQMKNLNDALDDMPTSMLVFSTIMRSLYVDRAVGTPAQSAAKFRKLRDDTRNDAAIYLRHILPWCKELVSSIEDFFENYKNLTYEEWSENLEDIVEEVQGYRKFCRAVIKMHQHVMTLLKERENEAKKVLKELKYLQQQYEERKREYEASASTKKYWRFFLLFLPGVNLIACPLLQSLADSDTADAVACGAQADTQEQAALAVANELMPALNHFIGGLTCAAGFFEIMESKLKQYANKAERSLVNPMKLHYTKMNKKAPEIISSCQRFMFALPYVRTELEAIPPEGTDQNYIDRWLEKQQEIIKETCTVRIVYNKVAKAIGHKSTTTTNTHDK